MKDKICMGSRESRLAVIQTELVRDAVKERFPEKEISILTMKTTGDRILDKSLDKIGGKGLFVKELDRALTQGITDLSVHSLKDVPMELPDQLPLVAFSKREDPRDVLVLPKGQSEPDFTKPVGCSSRRRMIQLKKLYPQAEFKMIRGNVLTRLSKVDSGEYAGTILAAAGLKRLGLEERISRYFSPEEMIPAAGQGILAVQGRAGEDYSFLEDFNDKDAEACARAERAFVRGIGGSCSSPIAAYAQVQENTLMLHGLYQEEKTGRIYEGRMQGPSEAGEKIGAALAEKIQGEIRRDLEEKRKQGKVWLVGAGPGDPGLFTVKGQEVLRKAQVVVYDALVGDGVLSMIPQEAERINVGKRSSHHLMPQEEISRLLAEKAGEGKRVVRLKGGDPFLFGRGGEELEVLTEAGIPYEVVPGVTSALAVPAYQGIPVTHRDFCSSVHIITGHKREGQEYDIDFEALVRTRGTLVFLMGAASLAAICRGLIEAGMDPKMPAAFLSRGTRASQERIVADVSSLPEKVLKGNVKTPAIIVVGEVCRLADRFAWVEKLPLGGAKVLVTRPKELAGTTSGRLRELGAEVLELPAIRTVRRKENPQLEDALSRLADWDWIVFTSPTGVRLFFEELKERRIDVRKLGKARIAVIGSGSERELEKYGLYGDLIPEVYDGEHLGKALAPLCRAGEKVLIPRAAIGNRELTETLEKVEGLEVSDIPLYDTVYGEEALGEAGTYPDLRQVLEKGELDYAVFTSASTVRGFAAAAGKADYARVKAICIGAQTRAAADALGMETWVADKATIDSLIQKLTEVHGMVKEGACGTARR